jgi:hypothetical protein
MGSRTALVFASVLISVLWVNVAWGDAVPPDALPCELKKAGDTCRLSDAGPAGLCVMSVCGQKKLPDGGTVTSNCLLCKASTADAGTRPTADAGTKPTADAGTRPPATKDESGCTVGGVSATKVLGPWLLALSVSGLLFVARRRRR